MPHRADGLRDGGGGGGGGRRPEAWRSGGRRRRSWGWRLELEAEAPRRMLSSRYEAVGLLDYARSGAGVGWGTESSDPTETDQNVRGEAAPNRWCWGEMLYTLHCTLCAELDCETYSTLCTEISEYCQLRRTEIGVGCCFVSFLFRPVPRPNGVLARILTFFNQRSPRRVFQQFGVGRERANEPNRS